MFGVDEVTYGGIPHWFGDCLAMRIRGQGGELKELHWPTVKIKKRRKDQQSRTKTVEVSAWKSWSATFDWLDFAERNGIVVPDGFEHGQPPQ